MLDALEIYVGILAATILFIATNAGVIGASRITYSMATYRQIPEIFRRLHPRFKTPWLSLLLFAGVAPIAVILPGDVDFVGTLYSFGATLSFTVAHASIIRHADAPERRGAPLPRAAEPPFRGVDWPLFAIFGGLATGAVVRSSSSSRIRPRAGWVSAGSRVGFAATSLYRRRAVGAPLRDDGQGAARLWAGARARVPAAARARSFRARPRTTRSTSPPASRPSAARRSSP